MRILNPCVVLARFDVANRGVRQPLQPHTYYAGMLVFDKALAQPHFAVVNCADALMSVFYSRFNEQPDMCRSVEFLFLRYPSLEH